LRIKRYLFARPQKGCVTQTVVKTEKTAKGSDSLSDRLVARPLRNRNLAISERHWLREDPYATAFFNSLSAVFPRGEAFMIESMRPWQSRLPAPLAAEVKTFIEQEAAHSREHASLNRALIHSGYDIAPLDTVIRQFVEFFRDADEITRLGATMCIEHMTAIVAAELLGDPSHMDGCDDEVRRLWLWHGVEEVEHKAVAFDVWMWATRDWSAARRWATRSALLIAVSASFFVNRTRGQLELLRQDGIAAPKAFWRMMHYGFGKGGIARRIMRPWAQFLKPGFHPWQIDDRALIASGEAMFAALEPVEAAASAPRTAHEAPARKAA
jgi:uncharacterized protein